MGLQIVWILIIHLYTSKIYIYSYFNCIKPIQDRQTHKAASTKILIYQRGSHIPDLCNISFITLSLSDTTTFNDTCVCAALPPYGSYCEKWQITPFEWCYLKKSSQTHLCPGARLSQRGIYFTTDQSVCNKSRSKCLH